MRAARLIRTRHCHSLSGPGGVLSAALRDSGSEAGITHRRLTDPVVLESSDPLLFRLLMCQVQVQVVSASAVRPVGPVPDTQWVLQSASQLVAKVMSQRCWCYCAHFTNKEPEAQQGHGACQGQRAI